ncbi:MAG: hypothetical protein JW816_00310 [Candidatus Buchananbacteria bacterium]|nr:hypothetical protein [Candidatus Buchananbacteria bacterium]
MDQDWLDKIEEKKTKKARKNMTKMKVSGAKAIALKNLIAKKTETRQKTRPTN